MRHRARSLGGGVSEYSETIVKLDRAQAYAALYDFVRTQPPQLDQLIIAAVTLLRARRVQGAYLIAKMLENSAYNPILSFAQAIGGYGRDSRADEDKGRDLLRAQIDRLSPVEQQRFYGEFEPITRTMVGNAFAGPDRADKVGRLIELVKAFTPPLRDRFDETKAVAPLDVRLLSLKATAASRLVDLEGREKMLDKRRVMIALRARVFPQDPQSRAFEVGPLLQSAAESYGWDAMLFGMEWFARMAEDFAQLETAARAFRPDVLIVDEQVVQVADGRALRSQTISTLRAALPGLKVVGLHLDPWSVDHRQLVDSAGDVDLAWTFAPDLQVWRDPAFAGKVLTAPLPYPILDRPQQQLEPALGFHGSIASYNWHRWLWLAAAERMGLKVGTSVTHHKSDSLAPQDSFRRYLETLSAHGAVLNFGMRSDLSIALTGRTFEVLAAGALLIQEATPELDRFLVAGEHYLPFTTLADLRAIADFVSSKPSEARAIAACGNAFFRTRYAPHRIMSYLDKALFAA